MTNHICCKCHRPLTDGTAAWDGNGNDCCWDCFGKYGWLAFPTPPTAEERHASFLASLKINDHERG